MTPAVLPVLLTLQRMRTDAAGSVTPAFAAGYLAVWSGFGVALTAVQWMLHRATIIGGHEMAANPVPASLILIGAGCYQLTPMKRACLAHCQSPLAYLLGHWRSGIGGAFRMGLGHGAYCLGCCWALMLVMFVGGVMSVATMAVLSLFILAERVLPASAWSVTMPGLSMMVVGAALLLL
jgi:predicted metal-binding membrane protein